jgi:hypothetical protein
VSQALTQSLRPEELFPRSDFEHRWVPARRGRTFRSADNRQEDDLRCLSAKREFADRVNSELQAGNGAQRSIEGNSVRATSRKNRGNSKNIFLDSMPIEKDIYIFSLQKKVIDRDDPQY